MKEEKQQRDLFPAVYFANMLIRHKLNHYSIVC